MLYNDFRRWTFESIDEYFQTTQTRSLSSLEELLEHCHTPDNFETTALMRLQENYLLSGDDWNEVELENKFISPLIVFSGIENKEFSYFLERPLSATINNTTISGYVDGMIASGFRSPKKPYFCLNEYKRQSDPNGDPRGQTLIAMLAAQAHNNDNNPIFGCYVIGRTWNFLALEGSQYAVSSGFFCTDDGIFRIFSVLKALRKRIETMIAKSA